MRPEAYHAPKDLERPWRIIMNIVLAKLALMSMFVGPLYLVGHWFFHAAVSALIFAVTGTTIYFTWYRRLEE